MVSSAFYLGKQLGCHFLCAAVAQFGGDDDAGENVSIPDLFDALGRQSRRVCIKFFSNQILCQKAGGKDKKCSAQNG